MHDPELEDGGQGAHIADESPRTIPGTNNAAWTDRLRERGGQIAARPQGESPDIHRKTDTFLLPQPEMITEEEDRRRWAERYGLPTMPMPMPKPKGRRK